ncbi:uncharacterized protein HaLaN_04813 [Haematococcus lacustris]|uniref:Uncharacterized protein n=1 Tax=Haematococcus lacustris TaxID=44745 RepID=A0A699YS64_HAELA|nr:uncharacterized protein HaLaN_04813 [Haematococcus lacustris]
MSIRVHPDVDNETERERVAQTQEHLQAAKAKVVTTNSEIDALALVKSQERLALTKATLFSWLLLALQVEQLPDKAKRQSQMEAANAKLQELEAAFRAVRAKEQELQNEHAKLLNGLDRARVQVQTKDRHADDIRKDLELASIEADKILADQVDLDMRIKAAAAQAKMESEVLTRKVEQLQRDRATLEAHAKMQHSALEEVRRDLDISMNDFLKEEAVGKDKASVFQVTLKQVGFMEEELLALRKEEAERTKILMELGSQRDRVALAIAQKLAKVKEVQLTTRIKEVELAELKKIRRETNRRIRDFEKLYDLVKNQRNNQSW